MCKSSIVVEIPGKFRTKCSKISSKTACRFEHTWPAMTYKLNGTIFVYNPEDKKHAEELNLWYRNPHALNISFYSYNRFNNFVEKPNVSEKCCLLVASRKNADENGRSGPEARLCKSSIFPNRIYFDV